MSNKNSHDQKRQSQPVLSVDFVTALSLDECRALLERADSARGQFVSLWDDHSFTVRCCRTTPEQAVARFWGTLEPREHGTWVWGTSIEESGEHPEWPSRRTTALLIALIVLATAALTLSDLRPLWIAALVVTIAALWRFWTWRRRHSEALRVIAWLWETLYVPIKEAYPDETQA
jgi:hypothetical protein